MKKNKKFFWFSSGASWIWSDEGISRERAGRSPSAYEVRRFRREFTVQTGPQNDLALALSADSRYVAWVDGRLLGRGPAHGDIRHHFFDIYDLNFLPPGRHVLAVCVFDYSKVQCDPPRLGAPAAVMSRSGGLVAELRSGDHCLVRTDESWRVAVDKALHFQLPCADWFGGFVGLFEEWHTAREEHVGWTGLEFDDSGWSDATRLYTAELRENQTDAMSPYGLMERMVPHAVEGSALVAKSVFLPGGSAADELGRALLAGKSHCVGAGEGLELIFEWEKEWTGFPRLAFAGGAGRTIRIGYAEALRLPHAVGDAVIFGRGADIGDVAIGFEDGSSGWTFDRRGTFEGFEDIVIADGRAWAWQPHHWRAAKFIRLAVDAGAEPLELRSFSFTPTHYPMALLAPFKCVDRRLEKISEINFHTLLLGMHETFSDCPYFEQLQYIGDSSLNAQVAMLGTGDYAATRQLIYHFDWSRVPEGWTQSRYPSRIEGIIPSQSLDWISAIHSYALMSGDLETVRDVWPGAMTVLDAYERHCGAAGLPEHLPFWNWIDWCPGWKRGVPPGTEEGPVLSHAAKYGMALSQAGQVAEWLGVPDRQRDEMRERHLRVKSCCREQFWNGRFFAENARDQDYGSRLGNAYAILAGFSQPNEEEALHAVLSNRALADCSFFGYYFVRQALWQLGGCDLNRELEPWFRMLDYGLTTWAEDTVFWRSLCHGWSANPQIDFYTRILGVKPLAPGFAEVEIRPLADDYESASGAVMSPRGPIRVGWAESILHLEVPPGIQATLFLSGQSPYIVCPGQSQHEWAGPPLFPNERQLSKLG